ncbi:MAG: hypothetical protein NVSMB55_22860 [Mycobacteriales bacterium]
MDMTIRMDSSRFDGTQDVVHVYRTVGDKIAEVWALAPPLS